MSRDQGGTRPRNLFTDPITTASEDRLFFGDYSDDEEEEDELELMGLTRAQERLSVPHDDTTPLLGNVPSISPLRVHRINHERQEIRRSPSSSVEDDLDQSLHDPLMNVVDMIEDEFEDEFYEELVPLEIKLALEENVFGWSHLSSDILGHLVFTVGAYLIVYAIVTQLQYSLDLFARDEVFIWVRLILSLFAGLSAFRMVRRRKRVWFRAAYGSKEYKRDEARRRIQVVETDRTTLLGRIRRRRDAFLHRSVQKKIRKAEARFERSHKRRQNRHQLLRSESSIGSISPDRSVFPLSGVKPSESMDLNDQDAGSKGLVKLSRNPSFQTHPTNATESIAHDQILFTHGLIKRVPYVHGGFFGAAPFMLANPHWIDILRHLMPDVYVEISRRVVHAPAPKLIHWAENNPVVAAFGTAHELENNGRVPNLEWDVFLDPHLVQRVEVVLDQKEKFLKTHFSSETAAGQSPSGKYQDADRMAEEQRNILKFYEKELRSRVRHLADQMLIAHGNASQLMTEQLGVGKKFNFSRVKRTRRTLGGGIYARSWLAVYAESLRLGLMPEEESTMHMSMADESFMEIRQVVSTDSTICDEDSDTASTSSDQKSPSRPRMSRVKSCPSLSDMQSLNIPASKRGGLTFQPYQGTHTSLSSLTTSKCPDTTMSESVATLRTITKCRDPIGLVFDIKSRHVPPRVWALVVDCMREAGVRVEGLASFIVEEIRDIGRFTRAQAEELLFFHSAGDIQQACLNGRIRFGDAVFFNGGSLLWYAPDDLMALRTNLDLTHEFDVRTVKSNYKLQPCARIERRTAGDKAPVDRAQERSLGSTIQQFKERFGLSIGIYVQEFAIDETAVNVLVHLVNRNTDIYDLGFAWGGLNGITVYGIQPGRFTHTDGFWNQRYAGAVWDPNLFPDDLDNDDANGIAN